MLCSLRVNRSCRRERNSRKNENQWKIHFWTFICRDKHQVEHLNLFSFLRGKSTIMTVTLDVCVCVCLWVLVFYCRQCVVSSEEPPKSERAVLWMYNQPRGIVHYYHTLWAIKWNCYCIYIHTHTHARSRCARQVPGVPKRNRITVCAMEI